MEKKTDLGRLKKTRLGIQSLIARQCNINLHCGDDRRRGPEVLKPLLI